jgi:tetratricopeptide (TPR) repeat protein
MRLIFTILFIALFSGLYSQVTQKNYFQGNQKEMFVEAESYFLYGDYSEALYLYQLLLNYFPNNYNLQYKIGMCLVHIPGRKVRAIPPLEAASNVISNSSKENTLKETRAPADALFQLGNAYRINNELDKALNAYNRFIQVCDSTIYDINLARININACERAKLMMQNPVSVSFTSFNDRFNDASPNLNALVSGNDSVVVFVTKLKFYDAVFYSKMDENGKWSAPINIIPNLGVDNKCYPTSISYDGKEIYFYRNDDFGGDIYVSNFANNAWSPIVKLNKNINTKYWESHAFITNDGKSLYFTSNRVGGYGGLDIYKSDRDAKGEWGVAVNLGNTINTPYNEDTPFLSPEGVLYFSSQGHVTIGGFDIFYSKLIGGNWSKPQNIGYPINTTEDDLFFFPLSNNKALMSLIRPEGKGQHDIYKLEYSLP